MPQSNKVALKVQGLSGFDKSHYHDLTANVGSLVPCMTDEVIPNSTINLNVAASVTLPPLASDTFMKLDLKLEAFAVPLRILYGGFEKFFADDVALSFDYSGRGTVQTDVAIPRIIIGSGWENFDGTLSAGTLGDYLGMKVDPAAAYNTSFSMMPFLAYHKIWDDWYRAPLVQRQLFSDSIGGPQDNMFDTRGIANLPFIQLGYAGAGFLWESDGENEWNRFHDGTTIFELRQRNYGFDYFTNAWPSLQFGEVMSVTPGPDGTITIAQIRAANSMQQFEERNNFAPRYYQALTARYGGRVSASVVQRPVYLGSATIPIKSYGVDVTANNSGAANNNPFAPDAGAQLGRARGEGMVNLIDNYHVDEPSYIMVIASVVPRAVYSSGISRYFDRYIREGGLAEMANPLLQNTGNQPIYRWELNGRLNDRLAFGYTDRYADWMTLPDRISGNLREGQSLQSFVLKRNFEGRDIAIGSSFLQIPQGALDEVSATDNSVSEYGCWMQFGFDYKVVQPLALYSLPSLQDPAYEHGNTVEVNRGGFRL